MVVVATLAGSLLAGCGGEVTTLQAAAGECFQDPEEVTHATSLDTVECEDAHDSQVIAVFQLDGDGFPGEEEVQAEASRRCTEDFFEYVGSTVDESDLELSMITPTQETWDEEDDREVVCWVSMEDGSIIEGSVAGSAL